MSKRSIPEIRAGLAQQEIFLRSLTKAVRTDTASAHNQETEHEQDLVHHWRSPWHWRGNRQGRNMA